MELACLDKTCDFQHWDRLFFLFISNRRFSMFTSSLSAWETLMEESKGANVVLSLQVTTAVWFNGSVCQRAGTTVRQPTSRRSIRAETHGQKKKNTTDIDCQKRFYLICISQWVPKSGIGNYRPQGATFLHVFYHTMLWHVLIGCTHLNQVISAVRVGHGYWTY